MWIPPVWSPFGLGDVVAALGAGKEAVPKLEQHLRERFGVEDAVATGSGTQALQVAIRLAVGGSEPPRGAVALPAYGCYDLVTAAVAVGAPVTFYDVDPATLAPDAESFGQSLRRASAVVVANLFGFPLPWDDIRAAADGPVVLIEDVAQGVGSGWRGRESGTFGDLVVLSFGRGKGWTGGGGGALLVREEPSDDPRRWVGPASGSRLRAAAVSVATWLLARPGAYGLPARAPLLALGETVYHPPTAATAIGRFQAALAHATRGTALAEVEVRRRNAERLRRHVSMHWNGATLPNPLQDGTASFLRLPVIAPAAWRDPSLRRAGVYRGYPRALPELSQVRPLLEGEEPRVPPGARELADRLVTLPTHSRSDPERVLALLEDLLE
jgi:dTDP-4-amino-4,6-dideoxygalactose transaminase